MMLLRYEPEPLFDDLIRYLSKFDGVIYITGYHSRGFYLFLKHIRYPRKFKLVYWNWQFKHATLIVRFRPDDPIFTSDGHISGYRGLEREILTLKEIEWEKGEQLRLRGYY